MTTDSYYSETCINDHLNAATTSLHWPETAVPIDNALKHTVIGLAYSDHLSNADYGHYTAPLLTNLHATLPRMATGNFGCGRRQRLDRSIWPATGAQNGTFSAESLEIQLPFRVELA